MVAGAKEEEMTMEQAEYQADERLEEAEKTIRNHTYVAVGVGLIPLPLVDLVSITAVQLNLVNSLSKVYGLEFKADLARNIIGAVVGSVTPMGLARPLASIVKVVPFIGSAVGMLSLSITAGAATYALGKVFVQHFESGGTFLTFDPAKVRAYYAEQFEKGTLVAKEAKAARA